MSVLIHDSGNSAIKSKVLGRREGGEIEFPHAIQEIGKSTFDAQITNYTFDDSLRDYIRVGDKFYRVGQSATKHAKGNDREGASRYEKDYYAPLLAKSLVELFQKSTELSIFCSHPPEDAIYRNHLMEAALGRLEVEVEGRTRTYTINYANTFDEPAGGLMNVLLTEDGTHYQREEISEGRALVIDIGGYTTDWLAVNEGGIADREFRHSVREGINEVVKNFEHGLRARYEDAFFHRKHFSRVELAKAIASGNYAGGNGDYPCEREANEVTTILLNAIRNFYFSTAEGPTPWQTIILTGGGSGMLFERLHDMLAHPNVILAEDPSTIQFANVRGGAKLWRLYEHLEVL